LLDLQFLPQFPIHDWQLLAFGMLLAVGYVCGELAKRVRLPRLVGYVAVGVALGDTGLGVVDAGVRQDMRWFIDVGLAFLLYELGQRLDLQWMRHEKWLWPIAVAQVGCTWLIAYFVLVTLDFVSAQAAVLAAVVVSSSPVVVMYMTHELNADGQVTSRVLTLSAINSIAALLLTAALLSWLHFTAEGGLPGIALQSAYLLFGSFALGLAVFIVLRGAARWFGRTDASQFVLATSMVVITVGLAESLKLSVLCALLTVGVLAKNANDKRRLRHVDFGLASELFYVVLFVSAGAAARFSNHSVVLLATLGIIGARYLGKAIPLYALASFTPLGFSRAGLVALGMTPLSGYVALQMLDSGTPIRGIDASLIAVYLCAVAILELVGPVLVEFALRRADEVNLPREEEHST